MADTAMVSPNPPPRRDFPGSGRSPGWCRLQPAEFRWITRFSSPPKTHRLKPAPLSSIFNQ